MMMMMMMIKFNGMPACLVAMRSEANKIVSAGSGLGGPTWGIERAASVQGRAGLGSRAR